MKKIILISILFLSAPLLVNGVIGDITVNSQPTYAVPPGTTGLLILDLTLPENLNSIKILNLGDAQQWDISGMYIFEDGLSLGWDGDENEIARKTSSPFWDAEILANSSRPRIFVTMDIASGVVSGRTIKPQATINSNKTVIGLERTISAAAPIPEIPQAPLARFGEAISAYAIRWNFLDMGNTEFGFRIKDASLKTKAEVIQSNLSYIDETGLAPDTCYSGRRASAFNDRGESSASVNFAEVCTLPEPAIPPEEIPPTEEETPPVAEEIPALAEPPAEEAPVIEKPVVEKPIINKPPATKPVVEQPVVEIPSVEESPEIESVPTPNPPISLFEAVKKFFRNLFSFFWR